MSVTADLEYPAVGRLVACLPPSTLEELAEGPLPDGDGDERDVCRVCRALEDLTSSGPAKELREWHHHVNIPVDIRVEMAAAQAGTPRFLAPRFLDKVREVLRALTYARCCAIYAAARAELAERQVREAA
jgi:hypothetical protein